MYKKIRIFAIAIGVVAIAFFILTDKDIKDDAEDIKQEVRSYKKAQENNEEQEELQSLTMEEIMEMSDEEREEINQLIEDGIDEVMDIIIPSDGLDDIDDSLLEEYSDGEKFEYFTLEEIFGVKEVKEAKEVAEKFIEQFHNYDGNEPDKYIKKAEEYTTNDFYKSLIGNLEVPYQDSFYKEFVSLEHHVSSYKPEGEGTIPLIYYVNGINISFNKEKTFETIDIYILELLKTTDGYKVNNMVLNVPFY